MNSSSTSQIQATLEPEDIISTDPNFNSDNNPPNNIITDASQRPATVSSPVQRPGSSNYSINNSISRLTTTSPDAINRLDLLSDSVSRREGIASPISSNNNKHLNARQESLSCNEESNVATNSMSPIAISRNTTALAHAANVYNDVKNNKMIIQSNSVTTYMSESSNKKTSYIGSNGDCSQQAANNDFNHNGPNNVTYSGGNKCGSPAPSSSTLSSSLYSHIPEVNNRIANVTSSIVCTNYNTNGADPEKITRMNHGKVMTRSTGQLQIEEQRLDYGKLKKQDQHEADLREIRYYTLHR